MTLKFADFWSRVPCVEYLVTAGGVSKNAPKLSSHILANMYSTFAAILGDCVRYWRNRRIEPLVEVNTAE